MSEAGVTAAGVVSVEPSKGIEAGLVLDQLLRPWSVSRLKVVLKDLASALSALVPLAPILWITPLTCRLRRIRLLYCGRDRCA